jgi:cob(I)alamin adenosyltransferase
MKIYTGGGDKGKTSLFSGERVGKQHERIEAYGNVDELNAILGALVASIQQTRLPDALKENLIKEVLGLQSDLFRIGSWLAVTPGSPMIDSLNPLSIEMVKDMEKSIDRMDAELPQLTSFILPGGTPSAAWAHVARTVCRRCERRVVSLKERSEPDETLSGTLPESFAVLIQYLNRLSDYLFILARYLNFKQAAPEAKWPL